MKSREPNSEMQTEELGMMLAISAMRDLPFSIGRYRVVRRIAMRPSGGEVYLAIDKMLSNDDADYYVVIKLMKTGIAAEKEARQASRVRHANVASVLAWGRFEDLQYVVYEFVDGSDLSDLEGKLDPRDAAIIIAGTARGAQAAHEAGWVHGDIKPDNIMDTATGPKLLDFGSAVRVGELSACSRGFGSPEQTTTGAVYASDVYGLATTLSWLVTGHSTGLQDRSGLTAIVAKGLSEDPRERYQTAASLADDLDAWLERRPTSLGKSTTGKVALFARRRPLTAVAALALLVLIVLGGRTAYQSYVLELHRDAGRKVVDLLNVPFRNDPMIESPHDDLYDFVRDGGTEPEIIRDTETLVEAMRALAAVRAGDEDRMLESATALHMIDAKYMEIDSGSRIHQLVLSELIMLYHKDNLNDLRRQIREFNRASEMLADL